MTMPTEVDETSAADAAATPSRIEPLATLPVFLKLAGRGVAVVGGSEPALWKAELLAAAGADVQVYAPELADGFHRLTASPPNGTVTLNRREWQQSDLKGCAIVVGAMTDDAEAAKLAAAARAAGIPVNVIDRPEFCDFQFGAIVNRSPLVVGVSTDGAAPVLGQAVRSLVESLLPEKIARWLEAAKSWRREGDRLGATGSGRRHFWSRFADLALRDGARPPTEADLEQLLDEGGRDDTASGRVTIVVADGQGVETLTLGAVRALRGADSIFFDDNVPSGVLGFARREAERHSVSRSVLAAEIVNLVLTASAGARRVVRLVSSDSSIARARDEANALRSAGLAVEILNAVKAQ